MRINTVLELAIAKSVTTDHRGIPPLGRLIGGVWMPLGDNLMIAAMHGTQHKVVDGKLTYQYKQLDLALREVSTARNAIAVDVGAHVGLWSMHLTRRFNIVMAFEPVRDFIPLFKHNVDMERAFIHNVALSNHNGNGYLKRGVANSGHNMLADDGAEVTLRTLDSYGLTACDFIKVDVEGHELAVLEGAAATLQKFKPVVCLESNGLETAHGGKEGDAVKYLEALGAKVRHRVVADVIMSW